VSVVTLKTINCDTIGEEFDRGSFFLPKSTRCRYWIAQEHTAADARREARLDGWKRVEGRDLCPPCYALHYPRGAP
jgi:hypothetical protein